MCSIDRNTQHFAFSNSSSYPTISSIDVCSPNECGDLALSRFRKASRAQSVSARRSLLFEDTESCHVRALFADVCSSDESGLSAARAGENPVVPNPSQHAGLCVLVTTELCRVPSPLTKVFVERVWTLASRAREGHLAARPFHHAVHARTLIALVVARVPIQRRTVQTALLVALHF